MAHELIELFQKALQKLNPYDSVLKVFEDGTIRIDEVAIPLAEHKDIYLLAMGKASVEMARAVQAVVDLPASKALVVCPSGSEGASEIKGRLIEAEHPVPGSGSRQAGREALAFAERIPPGGLLICCISGGSSSLVAAPAEGITLNELNQTHELLLGSGADIHQMNAVRKHLSRIKGGQLLRHLNPDVTVVNLLISDVPGDDPSIIGSGPTSPDASTFEDACRVLEQFDLRYKVPDAVRTHLEEGRAGRRNETLKEGEIHLAGHYTTIVASAKMLAEKVAEIEAEVKVAEEPYTEDVEVVASNIAGRAEEVAKANTNKPTLLVYYGESKVKVSGSGKGGRNQELALRGAMKIAGLPNITWLSVGTDGIDGPTEAAGALVNGRAIERARSQGLDPETYLENNDSYHFHEQMDTLVKTGPTGNNLMDLTLVLVE